MAADAFLPEKAMLLLTATLLDAIPPALEERVMALLPNSQSASIARNIRKRDRRLRILVRLLLAEGLRLMEDSPLAATLGSLEGDDNGRPFLPGSAWEFSFSHSHELALCLVGRRRTCGRLGVDAERLHPLSLADVAPAFCREEQEAIAGAPDAQGLLFALWTRKEAALKALGKGFLLDPASVNMLSSRPLPSLPNLWSGNFKLSRHPDYAAALAVENGPPQTVYRLRPFSGDAGDGISSIIHLLP